jgi:hypothetical protein
MNDITAWSVNKRYKWIYFKQNLCILQSVKWYPCPILPEIYPVILRPIINLTGMGAEVYKVNNEEEYKKLMKHGYFATPFIDGKHTSHDLYIKDGKAINHTVFEGIKNDEITGCFKYWELLKHNEIPELNDNIKKLLRKIKKYTGPLNVECIGDTIIEVHLRHGDIELLKNYNISKPVYLIPIWASPESTFEVDEEMIKKDPHVIDIIRDSSNISTTGNQIQRKALVITKHLP